jgi:hypothetical protein
MRSVLSGPLLSSDFVAHELLPAILSAPDRPLVQQRWRRFAASWRRAARLLGPASGLRAVLDVAATPVLATLGYRPRWVEVDSSARRATGVLEGPRAARAACLVATWGDDLGRAWRDAVHTGLACDARWCVCFNARALRIVDAERSWARRFVEIDLEACATDFDAFTLLWGLAGPAAVGASCGDARRTRRSAGCITLSDAVDRSARHTTRVCGSLQHGVRSAVAHLMAALGGRGGTGRTDAPPLDQQALTVVYRILFLLYAEARGLVPLWHPVYRASYSIEALRDAIDQNVRMPGLWESIQAIARMAHAGCRIDALAMPPFNGHLFAPEDAPAAERLDVDDDVVRRVLVALTTTAARSGAGRRRIAYADLGVEQLGAVYERLLDDWPGPPGQERPPAVARAVERPVRISHSAARPRAHVLDHPRSASRATARKATGTFYTPRSITDYLVRRTLHPLVAGATPERVLALRVVDPAMGSGAFLVAGCRYLASAYEAALVAAGEARGGDIGDADRAAFRRRVAQQCLFGVDLNPMAVQLARLSLWLATLAAGAPLTFLDHRLRVGDSLVGASPDDLARQPPGGGRRGRRHATLPLFGGDDLRALWRSSVPVRLDLARQPDDSLAVVRAKERTLRALGAEGSPLATWKQLADLWCAPWFWDEGDAPPREAFEDLCAAVRGHHAVLPARQRDAWLSAARATARRERFFHWTLEFPEVFAGADGSPRPDGGFDAVLGNPPWDIVRGDVGEGATREAARRIARRLMGFVRESGLYTGATDSHANRYQLFVERAIALLRAGGRLGLVVPWGLLSDHGSAGVRRAILERCAADAVVSFENRSGVFPIHRSVRFALVTATTGGSTGSLRCRLGEDDPAVLDRLPDAGGDSRAFPVALSRRFLERVSGDRLAVPDTRTPLDVVIVDRLFHAAPALGSPAGWGATFGRELNATEDRPHFRRGAAGLPVVEGKQIAPFHADVRASVLRIDERDAARLLDPAATWGRSRLAYRDVASATNRLTLIAAILPPRTVTTHTIFCLKTALGALDQAFLCGVLNSFVLNYLARLWVTTHVTVALVERLPVPRPESDDPRLVDIARLASRLAGRRLAGGADYARLQALVAALYGLSREELAHVAGTFPLVDRKDRDAAVAALGC